MNSRVVREIVEKNLCIGCGLCAAICPSHTLEMDWNRYGEYNPREKAPCELECGECVKICPFAAGNDNEDRIGKSFFGSIPEIHHLPETGYYLDCYAGYAPETRMRAASGGVATWLLSTLLKKGIVDYVIAVVPNNDPDKLFRYAILTDSKSVLDSSGSVYYPVELSGVLREILDKSGKCAIIGLPCFIKAIRLGTQNNKKLRDRILVTVGLVCGQLKNKHYTEYLSVFSGVNGPLHTVNFRGKSPEKPASNLFFSCTDANGKTGKIFWDEGMAEAWIYRWFTPNSCNYCDDIFAECADISCMDAWLPEFTKDYKGTNLVLVRSPHIQNLIVEGIRSGEINLKSITIRKVIVSQSGNIDGKRKKLASRLYIDSSSGINSPQKRVKARKIINPFRKKILVLMIKMQSASRNVWAENRGNGILMMKRFHERMNEYIIPITRWNRIAGTCEFPFHYAYKIRNKIRSFFP